MTGKGGFHLLDATALVVGYSLASMLVRAYWPHSGQAGVVDVALIGLVFLWLGLAMSGPVVLLIRRPPPTAPEGDEPLPASRTWAELSWMIIGFYWIGLTILVVPVRMQGTRFLDSAMLGVFPVLAALALRWVAPKRTFAEGGTTDWTHRVGIGLLLSWPFAWLGLIVLGKSLL